MKKLALLLITLLSLNFAQAQALKTYFSIEEALKKPELVYDLDLSEQDFTIFPESIGNLTKLEFLDLSENQLTSLPESIGNLNKLEELYLYGNQLTSLPESIGNLTSLTLLLLYDNQLSPEVIEKLRQALPDCRIITD